MHKLCVNNKIFSVDMHLRFLENLWIYAILYRRIKILLWYFSVVLNNDLNQIVQKFSEHYHDAWASRKLENGWTYGEQWSDVNKTHPRLKPYNMLNDYERERYKEPVRESLKALLAIGWSVEHAEVDVPSTNRSSMRRSSKSQVRNCIYYIFVA